MVSSLIMLYIYVSCGWLRAEKTGLWRQRNIDNKHIVSPTCSLLFINRVQSSIQGCYVCLQSPDGIAPAYIAAMVNLYVPSRKSLRSSSKKLIQQKACSEDAMGWQIVQCCSRQIVEYLTWTSKICLTLLTVSRRTWRHSCSKQHINILWSLM